MAPPRLLLTATLQSVRRHRDDLDRLVARARRGAAGHRRVKEAREVWRSQCRGLLKVVRRVARNRLRSRLAQWRGAARHLSRVHGGLVCVARLERRAAFSVVRSRFREWRTSSALAKNLQKKEDLCWETTSRQAAEPFDDDLPAEDDLGEEDLGSSPRRTPVAKERRPKDDYDLLSTPDDGFASELFFRQRRDPSISERKGSSTEEKSDREDQHPSSSRKSDDGGETKETSLSPLPEESVAKKDDMREQKDDMREHILRAIDREQCAHRRDLVALAEEIQTVVVALPWHAERKEEDDFLDALSERSTAHEDQGAVVVHDERDDVALNMRAAADELRRYHRRHHTSTTEDRRIRVLRTQLEACQAQLKAIDDGKKKHPSRGGLSSARRR